MRLSLVITTYNWKEALELTLRSVAAQVEPPFEVLIADDGSRQDTTELVRACATRLECPLRHVWQEDQGFRLSRIRNRAIAAARGDYVVIVDGDMILHPSFIADHAAAARPGCFIQGVRALSGPRLGRAILEGRVTRVGFFSADLRRRRHTIRSRPLSRLLFRPHTGERGIRGSNQGYWRADLVRVNGFNEGMTGWGYEDGEIASRLYHCGVRRRDLRFQALAVHIHHPTRRRTGDNPNIRLMTETRLRRLQRCEIGLAGHLAEPTGAGPAALRDAPA